MSTENKTHNSKNDANRWLDGEISLGKFIHNSSLETCFSQASDFAGGIANAYADRIQNAYNKIEVERKRAKAEYVAEEEKNDSINTAASSAAHRAYTHALSILNFETHAVNVGKTGE